MTKPHIHAARSTEPARVDGREHRKPWQTPRVIIETISKDTASDSNPASDNAFGFGTHSWAGPHKRYRGRNCRSSVNAGERRKLAIRERLCWSSST